MNWEIQYTLDSANIRKITTITENQQKHDPSNGRRKLGRERIHYPLTDEVYIIILISF